MKHTINTIAFVSTVFILALAFSSALAQPIADPVLYFNPLKTDQTMDDKVWRNAGVTGGELPHSNIKPVLEEGIIEIKAIGFREETKWYTAKESNSTFSNGTKTPKTPVVNLEDFTLGLLMRVNGPLFVEEHHVLGLQARPLKTPQND